MKGILSIKPLLFSFYIVLAASMCFLTVVVADNHESDAETESSVTESESEVVELKKW